VRPYGDDKLVSQIPTASSVQTQQAADCRCNDRPPSIGERVLPQGKGVQRLRDGQHRWLLVSAEPEQVWPLARKFLEMRGYRVSRDEPAVGLMETDWKNIFDIAGDNTDAEKNTDGIPVWRERLRLRLEPGQQSDRTEVYLTQYRSERAAGTGGSQQWQLRAPDGGRAIEMLNRFARYLTAENVEDAVSLSPVASKLGSDGDGGSVLIVEAEFAKVWRRTGIALDALGFTIEDSDRASRTYSVYNELSTGKSQEELEHGKPQSATVRESYRIQLDQKGEMTELSIRTKAGEVDNSEVAVHVLNLLHSQFQ
ncbi:MAG: outer membrane protein assembly factor BamC, partial [Gammaproteobacteria bacterium]|nr:outer membrane protein assembly factor BamC [Gammaproteobacteria bacterium]